MADTLTITTFETIDSPKGVRHDVTWEELIEALSIPEEASTPKDKLSAWSPTSLKNDYSADDNVEHISLLVFDVDIKPIPTLDDMRNMFHGLRWFAYSSPSSLVDALRWRLIVGVSRPIVPAEYSHVWQAFTERLPFDVGPQSKNLSRRWFNPRYGTDGTFVTSERDNFATV